MYQEEWRMNKRRNWAAAGIAVCLLSLLFISCGSGIRGTWTIVADEGEQPDDSYTFSGKDTVEEKYVGEKASYSFLGTYSYKAPLGVISFARRGKINAAGKVDKYTDLDNEIVYNFIIDGKSMFLSSETAKRFGEAKGKPEEGDWVLHTKLSTVYGDFAVIEKFNAVRDTEQKKKDGKSVEGKATLVRTVDPDGYLNTTINFTGGYIYNEKDGTIVYIGKSGDKTITKSGHVIGDRIYITEDRFEKK